MKLTSVSIENYRSIDEPIVLDFTKAEKSCYFAFGINETGKSSTLKACALLDEDYRSKYKWAKDCFKENKREGKITEIDYYFDLNAEELGEVKKILEPSIPEDLFSQIKGVRYYLEGDTDDSFNSGFLFTFKDDTKTTGYFRRKKVVKPAETPTPENAETPNEGGEKMSDVLAETPRFILLEKEIPDAEKENYESIDELNYGMGAVLSHLVDDDFVEEKLPRVIFWDSSSRYLINGTIDLNAFKEKPTEVSVPLFNMFKFIKLDKDSIKSEIDASLKEPTDRHKLATDLSQATTKHLNKIWKEHEIEAQVTIEASGACDVHFADKDANTNFFEMQDRSDGFQRFISFILTLSAENLNEELENTLILLDEPEVHLHPSGIEYLKDELLNISTNNNYILAASHSIFLVDKKCLERHITVKKIAGRTSISYVDPNNPFQEEVIFRALNTSIYELIQPLSIIFEGSIDSDIFHAVKHKFRSELTGLVNIGGIGATGATEVKKYEKFFKGNLMVQAMALFDSDDEGRKELDVLKAGNLFNDNAFELKDMYDIGKRVFTLEDLLPKDIVLETAKSIHKSEFAGIDETKPILEEIKRLKHELGITDDKKMESLKSKIAKAVLRETDSHVLSKEKFKTKYENYYNFLEGLETKISTLQRN